MFRASLEDGAWSLDRWADATGTITQAPGFNLGGIVVTADRSALVVAQGNVGALWRFDLHTAVAPGSTPATPTSPTQTGWCARARG